MSDSAASADTPGPKVASAPGTALRRPWVAFLVSLLWPGLGQLYAARPARARAMAAIGLALILAQAIYLCLFAPDSVANIAIGGALAVAGTIFSIYAAVDAARLSRRARQVVLTRYNRAWIYGMVVVLFVAAIVASHFLTGRYASPDWTDVGLRPL